MTPIVNFGKRHPTITYYVLVFLISWGGVIIAVVADGIPATPEQTTRLFPVALTLMLAGPFLTGLFMTGLLWGKEGYRNLLSKTGKWRLNLKWYAFALLLIPGFVGSILWILSQTWPVYIPAIAASGDKLNLLLSGIGIGLAAGFFEEVGWTGFVIPVLRKNHNIVVTGLIAGLFWGLWHFLVTYWASGDATGHLSRDLFLPPLVFYIGVLPAYRVLMVWMYDRTESLLLAMLMHASLTTCTISILLPPATGNPLIKYYLILSAVLWALVANLPNKGRSPVSKPIQ